jgi:hypothetical protein
MCLYIYIFVGHLSPCTTSSSGYYNLRNSLLGYYPFHPDSISADLALNLGNIIPSANPPTAVDGGPWAEIPAAVFQQNKTSVSNPSDDPYGQYFTLPNIQFSDLGLSVCLWYMPTFSRNKDTSSQHIFHFGNTAGSNTDSIRVYQNGASNHLALQIFVGSSVILSQPIPAAAMNQDVWSHLCLVISDRTVVFYADASSVASYTVHKPNTLLTSNYVARSLVTSNSLFIGQIADFRIFRRALTSVEVQAVYQYRGDGLTPDLFLPCIGSCPPGISPQCIANGTLLCCSSGQYYNTNSSICARCVAGTYNPNGTGLCRNCSAGSYSAGGAAECANCSAGEYTAVSGASACVRCPAGMYGPSDTEKSCLRCPAGTASSEGAVECTACEAGKRSLAGSELCFPCAAHSSSTRRASLCSANVGFYDLSSQLAGYYPFTTNSTPPEPFSDLLGNSTDLVPSNPAPNIGSCGPWVGSNCADFVSSRSVWFSMPPLAMGWPKFSVCLWFFSPPLISGSSGGLLMAPLFEFGVSTPRLVSWVDDGGDLHAQLWSPGINSSNWSVLLVGAAPPGVWAQACVVADGSDFILYSDSRSNRTSLSFGAALVPQGFGPGFVGRWTSAEQQAGPSFKGKIAEFRVYGVALSSWEVAAVASYRVSWPDPNLFVQCPSGTYRTGIGGVQAGDCTPCAPGRFSGAKGANVSTTCAPCSVGTSAPGWGFAACEKCAHGSYQTGVEGANCTNCEPGKYSTALGAVVPATCLQCQVGTYQTGSGLWYCNTCGSGQYGTGIGMTQAVSCLLCPSGTYQSGLGMTAAANCTPCEAGSYATGFGETSCVLCAEGKFSTGTGLVNSTCNLCVAGTFQTGSGAYSTSDCRLCGAGTYQTGLGIVSSANCSTCSAGTFQTGMGMPASTNCSACFAGTYQTALGMQFAENCTACAAGTYQTANSRSSACFACAAGTFSSISGRSFCSDCPMNAFSNEAASTCSCRPGYTASAAGSSSGIICLDVDECTAMEGSCSAELECINTDGSFQCGLGAMNRTVPVCTTVYPPSCRAAGGSPVWILISHKNASDRATTVLFAGKNASVVEMVGNWVSTICPQAEPGPGLIAGTVIADDGVQLCNFNFMYMPGPARIMPRSMPLSGGIVLLHLPGFAATISDINCSILFGSVRGGSVYLDGGMDAFNITVPQQAEYGKVPLQLDCDLQGRVDLGVAIEFRRPAVLELSSGASAVCKRFIQCILFFTVYNPPGLPRGGLRAWAYDAQLDSDPAVGMPTIPNLNVQVCPARTTIESPICAS